MGIIPIAVPTFYDKFPDWFTVIFDSGITAAAITAVLLNIVFNIIGRKEEAEGPDLRRGTGTGRHLRGRTRRGSTRTARPPRTRRGRHRIRARGCRQSQAAPRRQPVSYISAHVLDAAAGVHPGLRGQASGWPTRPGR